MLEYDNAQIKAGLVQMPSLSQEIQGVHKQVSELDELLDQLTSRLEFVLSPDHPRPAPDDSPSQTRDGSGFRTEVQVIQNRMRTQLNRLSNLVARIDQ